MTLKSIITAGFLALMMTCCGSAERVEAAAPAAQSPYFLDSDKFITLDGIDIRYRDEGPKDGAVIVMVHGFSSSLETWDALAKELVSDYRIIRLDLPGHGLSGPDNAGDYSNEKTVGIFSQFLAALDLKQPVIIGNSLGGLVAWRAAAQSPETASKLVLISPGGFSINGVTERAVDVPVMVKYYLTKAPLAGVKQASAALYGDPKMLTDLRVTQIHDLMSRPGNGYALVLRAGQFTLPAPEIDLAKVDSPTLIIWGEKDVMVPSDHGPKFVRAMPNALLLPYDGIGHVPQEESPVRLAQDIHKFITDGTQP